MNSADKNTIYGCNLDTGSNLRKINSSNTLKSKLKSNGYSIKHDMLDRNTDSNIISSSNMIGSSNKIENSNMIDSDNIIGSNTGSNTYCCTNVSPNSTGIVKLEINGVSTKSGKYNLNNTHSFKNIQCCTNKYNTDNSTYNVSNYCRFNYNNNINNADLRDNFHTTQNKIHSALLNIGISNIDNMGTCVDNINDSDNIYSGIINKERSQELSDNMSEKQSSFKISNNMSEKQSFFKISDNVLKDDVNKSVDQKELNESCGEINALVDADLKNNRNTNKLKKAKVENEQ